MEHLCALRFESLPRIEISRILDDYIFFVKCFVMKVIRSIYMRFTYIPIFTDAKFLSPQHYYEEMDDRG